MKVVVDEKMKKWVAAYIRAHRKEGKISIHVVYSKFNEDFRATFNIDPRVVVPLMVASGFLKGRPSKGGYCIWLPEDVNKGKGRPLCPREPEINDVTTQSNKNQLATPTHQNGELEMKTNASEENAIEPQYTFEKIPHPETGKVDVLELIQYIVSHLNDLISNQSDMDGFYAVIKMSINHTLGSIGIPTGSCPGLSRILQEMALIKRYGRSQWGVLDSKVANYFVTARSYIVAKEAMMERSKRNQKIARLENKVKKLESSTTETQMTSRADDDLVVDALALAELYEEERDAAKVASSQLEALVEELSTQVRQLEGKLANREDTRTALAEQIAAKKAALKKA